MRSPFSTPSSSRPSSRSSSRAPSSRSGSPFPAPTGPLPNIPLHTRSASDDLPNLHISLANSLRRAAGEETTYRSSAKENQPLYRSATPPPPYYRSSERRDEDFAAAGASKGRRADVGWKAPESWKTTSASEISEMEYRKKLLEDIKREKVLRQHRRIMEVCDSLGM